MQFDWDDGNRSKCLKHGLSISEIEYALSFGAKTAADPIHSLTEQRFVAVSRTSDGRPVYIVFCLRGEQIRPISARYMHRKEAIRHGFAS